MSVAADNSAGAGIALGARRHGLFFLGAAVATVGFAMMLQMGVNSNFVAQDMHLTAFQQGLLESARESCGIIALGVLALLATLAEPVIAAAMLLLFSAGFIAYLYVPNYGWLIVANLVWSQGLHVWMPLPSSMTLALAEPGQAGRRLGQIQAAGAVGAGVGIAAAFVLGLFKIPIREMFVVAGLVALVAAGCCLGMPRGIKVPGTRLVFRRQYWLYYLLTFLEGWRKQIFIAFAGFLLVRKYDTPVTTMLGLWLAIQALTWLVSPRVGHWLDRHAERRLLMCYYASLTLFFVGYAFIEQPAVLYAIYVLDSVFFVGTMGLTTYMNRIVPPAEHTATLSMGVACNHIAACLMPLIGGLVWQTHGHRAVFLVGAAVAAITVLPASLLPKHPGPRPADPGALPATPLQAEE